MNNLVNCVLLIDDDKPTNFYNSMVLSKHSSFAKIQVKQSGEAALQYLINVEKGIELKPNLIFLDLNMPAMNGWEFLIEYSKLNHTIIENIKVVILTTSADINDIEKSKANYLVDDLISKPLSFPLLNNVIEKHFFKTSFL
ncbi:response regulator [Aquimarina sp. 2201CG14-23]|uniref:response regulator n=1 Tax=Aquimarina mycalae TaxID=3040073 RepID=UPI00247806F4|nr:response regulator [Aquimarina sp. 2201CG14-23]MDH7448131.1 response regulator [Aquimarina sp. 2201CG14-23]